MKINLINDYDYDDDDEKLGREIDSQWCCGARIGRNEENSNG